MNKKVKCKNRELFLATIKEYKGMLSLLNIYKETGLLILLYA